MNSIGLTPIPARSGPGEATTRLFTVLTDDLPPTLRCFRPIGWATGTPKRPLGSEFQDWSNRFSHLEF